MTAAVEEQVGITLGDQDDLVEEAGVDIGQNGLAGSATPEDTECATLTIDSDGLAQLWDAGRKPVRYWREKTH